MVQHGVKYCVVKSGATLILSMVLIAHKLSMNEGVENVLFPYFVFPRVSFSTCCLSMPLAMRCFLWKNLMRLQLSFLKLRAAWLTSANSNPSSSWQLFRHSEMDQTLWTTSMLLLQVRFYYESASMVIVMLLLKNNVELTFVKKNALISFKKALP